MSEVASISSRVRRSSVPEHSIDDENDDQSERSSHATLIHGDRPEASVGLLHLFVLTFGIAGLQVVWSVILANGSPFLMSLGLSKSLTALVWIASPLSGMIVQPVMGVLSDQSRTRWGRRRPFIVGGAIGTIISMLALAWVEDIIHGLAKAFGGNPHNHALQTLIVVLAVFCIWALNISIQPLQGSLRAFIIENCPTHQQTQASAWASGMVGIGNIVGYLSGFSALPALFSAIRLTQFQALCFIATTALIITIPVSCFWIHEKIPKDTPLIAPRRAGLAATVKDLIHTYKYMPGKIRDVLHIQFWSWMGWFAFLFYSTTFVGEFYIAPIETKLSTQLSPNAVRSGAFASLLFAIVALVANLALPFLLQTSKKHDEFSEEQHPSSFIGRVVNHSKFDIQPAWTCAHLLLACGMFATFFVHSLAGATVLVAFVGISWAFSLSAPFAIIGTEIAARHQSLEEDWDRSEGDGAGAIMGLHNVSIAAPQIVAALISSGIFWVAQISGSQEGTRWVLRASGIAGLAAAYLTIRMRK